jgi:hypothetical protein
VLADELGIAISVCHHPPGTSKWTGIPRMNGQFGHHDRRIATEPGLQQR